MIHKPMQEVTLHEIPQVLNALNLRFRVDVLKIAYPGLVSLEIETHNQLKTFYDHVDTHFSDVVNISDDMASY